ncbi:fumarylacetoacetate hydrolase family protein [Seohaeicola saemankumensis]|nr:fumarylacetoacetate hydrolase family protein [Seohaeicola saemankumensis]MCA0869970.1 fumarylacetoacetate hydrolase family protein [Seohaeicola saemankumensis]
MRLVSFLRPDGTASYGTAEGETIRDAGVELAGKYADLRAVLAAGATAELAGKGPELAMGDVTMLPPVPNPDKILCIGLNYMSHIKETGRDKPTHPSIFNRYPSSILGHGVPLVRPKVSTEFDYEGELAVVIGKECRHVSEADAWDVIAGYSCFNDGSIRDFQRHTSQFWPGKSFEASGSMGPWIVTPDEVGDITKQRLTTRINGNVEQQAGIDDLAINIPQMIAYASTVIKLLPGDVIATGTPGGVGRFRKPQLYLEPGMTAEIEITGVGTLVNGVVDEA